MNLRDATADPVPKGVPEPSEQERKPRVLIVEDNYVNQKVTHRLIEKIGCRPSVANNGLEALAALEREEFDDVVQMLADGFSTRRGRRGAYLHFDQVNGRLRARRGARLTAVTNAGTIPDQFDHAKGPKRHA